MAGIGPAPAESRRRANTPARGEWVDLYPLDAPTLPALPRNAGIEMQDEVPVEIPWSERTLATWASWREDPASGQWSPSEVQHAFDTIYMHNSMGARNANEIRLRMDGLGLTPKGKRDLRWRVASEPVSAKRAGAARGGAGAARRARLSLAAVPPPE